MAVPFLLIDGYNLMHAAGLARPTYGPGDLERCRLRLLQFLNGNLNRAEIVRATVVFDAFDAPSDLSRRQTHDGLKVLFALSGSDADSLIEELIASHSAPRQIVVVSGDRRLQKAARRRRAKSLESGQFLDLLLRRTPHDERTPLPRDQHPKYDGEMSTGELAQWLAFFDDVSDVELDDLPPAPPAKSDSSPAETARETTSPTESAKDEWDQLFEDLGLADELAQDLRRDRELLDSGDDWDRLRKEVDEL